MWSTPFFSTTNYKLIILIFIVLGVIIHLSVISDGRY